MKTIHFPHLQGWIYAISSKLRKLINNNFTCNVIPNPKKCLDILTHALFIDFLALRISYKIPLPKIARAGKAHFPIRFELPKNNGTSS